MIDQDKEAGPVSTQTRAHPALCPTDSKGWQAALQALSLPELSGALEDRVCEMGESPGGQPVALTPPRGQTGEQGEPLAAVGQSHHSPLTLKVIHS